MKSDLKITLMIIMSIFYGWNSQGQHEEGDAGLIDRKPAVAGQFYPADPKALKAELSVLFANAEPAQVENVLAVISPHAGYVFSGEVAASSFNQVDPDKQYENIFILASSHRMSFNGASIYSIGDYLTPLGKVSVNLDLAKKLVDGFDVFTSQTEPHIQEHSLEVQLPFLQYRLNKEFRIVPIILGTQSPSTSKEIAEALRPYFNEKNLFVISSDFSHYPDYENACMVDKATADAIMTNSPDELIKTLEKNDRKGIGNLATSLCGWTSVLSLLYMTEKMEDVEFTAIEYKNSGDAERYGEKDRVVGYYSIVVSRMHKNMKEEDFGLNQEEKKTLLHIARNTIEEYIRHNRVPDIDKKNLTQRLREPYGAFVTLKKDGMLRGCIGRFEASGPLYEVVQQLAVSSSTQDSRFPPVAPEEIDELEIEISVLTPLRRIHSIDEFELGKHGIYIKKGFYSGTFLPQVATETGWSTEEFLGHCARDKAHIGWDGWKTAELYVYEAYIFGEAEQK
jgi:AmmeMemoRadiSam system protein B/AmmeMemoRadiSam system protein A